MATRRQPLNLRGLMPGLFAATLLCAVALAAFLALWFSAPGAAGNRSFSDSYLWHVVRFSFWQASRVSADLGGTSHLSRPARFTGRRFPGRRSLLRLCAMTLILPVLVLIAACIFGFVVLIFEIIYEAKVIKMLNSAKNAMLTGMVPNKASVFVAVICFISAAVSFFSVFGDAVLYGWIRVPLGLTSVALNVLYGLLVLQFNKMLKNAGMAR